MSDRRKKTVLRTIRITQEVDDVLRESAQDKNLSVNALIAAIMTKYVEWDRYVEKLNFISIASETFKTVLAEIDGEKLEKIAKEYGSKMAKTASMFFFKKADSETFLEVISLFSKYSRLRTNEIETSGRNYTITLHHNLGEKWSTFVRHFMAQAFNNVLGFLPQTDVSENVIIISFSVP